MRIIIDRSEKKETNNKKSKISNKIYLYHENKKEKDNSLEIYV